LINVKVQDLVKTNHIVVVEEKMPTDASRQKAEKFGQRLK
jgi:hypothetical protein